MGEWEQWEEIDVEGDYFPKVKSYTIVINGKKSGISIINDLKINNCLFDMIRQKSIWFQGKYIHASDLFKELKEDNNRTWKMAPEKINKNNIVFTTMAKNIEYVIVIEKDNPRIIQFKISNLNMERKVIVCEIDYIRSTNQYLFWTYTI